MSMDMRRCGRMSDLTRFNTYKEYRQSVVEGHVAPLPHRPRPILTEEEFDRLRWGIGEMEDTTARFNDHLDQSKRMDQNIKDNTMAHERVAVLLEQITEKIRDQQKEIRDLTEIAHQTHAKVTNGLSHRVEEIHEIVKAHDDKLLGCVDVETYKSDHPSGIEVVKQTKKRRLEALTILVAILAAVGGFLGGML